MTTSKKLGIIQTGGLGDIHISLPIALYYFKKNFKIFWPIFDHWLVQMKHYVPWVNWIGVSVKDIDHAFEKPKKILDSLGIEHTITLYNYLNKKIELSNTPYFPHVSFDRFKYLKAKVPFYFKWKLDKCIKRDRNREDIIYNKYVKEKKYIVTHLTASNHEAKIDKSLLNEEFQIIKISEDGYVLDWLKVIENASILFMTDSVMANITDQLNLGKIRYFVPRANIFNTPIFKNEWIWLKNENIDPRTNLTGIKFD